MNVSRGPIVADPWIDNILEGRKDWEMRSQATSVRGWFGLIRKGSGTVVGLARLVDCGRVLDQAEMIANFDHHCIPST
ncbi:MAG: ASCH domain-containing protein [Rhodobacteraceae bacterium]|nr:ASCH domain-containing protein [Paracoccaceae bacterium]